MLKKTFKLFCALSILFIVHKSAVNLQALNENRYYLPIGINYLDPDNFQVDPVNNIFSANSINMFRIKPATTYSLYSLETGLFRIGNFIPQFYDCNGVLFEYEPVYEYSYSRGEIASIIFETPPSTYFINIHFDIICENPKDVTDFSIDKYFVFFEGETDPYGYQPYLGPNNLYPLVNCEEAYYYTSYSDNISVEGLKNCLYAFDDADGDVTDRIVISEDSYTENAAIIGSYPVSFSVSDISGNVTTLTINIVVRDWDVPIITGPDVLEIEPNQLLTEEHLLSKLSAYDEYDGLLTSNIEIIRNDYTANYSVKGIYQVEFQVSDSSGNIGLHTINIDVKDRTAPVITGPTTINKPNNTILPLNEIVNQYEAEDNVEGDITDWIEIIDDNYSLHPNRVGTHTITLLVSDCEGNTTTLTVAIVVYDATAPVFMIDINKITVTVENDGILLCDLLTQLELLGKKEIGGVIEIFNDEYSGNEKTPGTYGVVFKVAGEYHKLEITVNEKEERPPIVKTSWLKKISSFFKTIWASLRRWVSNYL